MNKYFIITIILFLSISIVNAYNGDLCNDTYSPCGGGCTSTDLSYMFLDVTDFNNTVGDISNWDTSCITNMQGMFQGSNFNQDISLWNTSNVEDMSIMFAKYGSYYTIFNQNISMWDTSKVTTMNSMFWGNTEFNQDISGWNTTNVIDMGFMFAGDYFNGTHYNIFNKDISGWDTSNVESFEGMFLLNSMFNQDISVWNTSKVTLTDYMFENSKSFNQNLSSWDVSQVTDMTNMFHNITLSLTNYDSLLIFWSSQTLQNNVVFDGGNSKYSMSAISSRNILNNTFNWIITDGGLYVNDNTITGNTVDDLNSLGVSLTNIIIALFIILLVASLMFGIILKNSEFVEKYITYIIIAVIVIMFLLIFTIIL